MRTLITGGSGYLGNHVREWFEADDLSRTSGMDVLSSADAAFASEFDLVIHFAAHLDKSPSAAEQVFLTNVEGTVNVLRNVRKDAIFIFASTKDVYGRFADNHREVPETCETLYSGQSALEWSKLIAERYVEYFANQNGFRSCIFRLSTVYAPKSEGTQPGFVGAFADAINYGETIELPATIDPRRDILHVDDLSKAIESFRDSVIRHGLYNLGGGPSNAITLRSLVAKMEEISGLQAVTAEVPTIGPPTPLNYVSDLRLVTQELDWKPSIKLDEGLASLFK